MSMTSLNNIALTIDRNGFDALDEAAISHVLGLSAASNASPVLAQVFGDASEPAPVRARAFGRLAMQIASGAPRSGFTLAA